MVGEVPQQITSLFKGLAQLEFTEDDDPATPCPQNPFKPLE